MAKRLSPKDRLKLAKELMKQWEHMPMFSKPEGPIAKRPKNGGKTLRFKLYPKLKFPTGSMFTEGEVPKPYPELKVTKRKRK